MKAWAVLTAGDEWMPGKGRSGRDELIPFGNGSQFQYPIFHSRKEALEWRKEDPFMRGRIVRCEVKIEARRKA